MANPLKITENSKRNIAEFISNIAYAPLISIPIFTLINFFLLSFYNFLVINTICIVFAGFLPVILVILWLKSKSRPGVTIDMDIPNRSERNYPLLLVISSYLLGTITLYLINAPLLITVLMFCYFSNTLIVFFINLYWKISIHALGVSGPMVALIYLFGVPGIIFALLIPAVMWSRLYLKEHTISQVIIGALLGFSLTTLQFYLFL